MLSKLLKIIFYIGLSYITLLCIYYCYIPVFYYILFDYNTQSSLPNDYNTIQLIYYKITQPPTMWINYYQHLSTLYKWIYLLTALPITILSYIILFFITLFTIALFLWNNLIAPIIGSSLQPIIQNAFNKS
jgi:hypothetical protein